MKNLCVWIYLRLLALLFFCGALVFGAVSAHNIRDAVGQLQRSYKATATVSELVERVPDPPKADATAATKPQPDPLASAGFDPAKKLEKAEAKAKSDPQPVVGADTKPAGKADATQVASSGSLAETKPGGAAEEKKQPSCTPMMAPVFVWKDAAGVEHRHRHSFATCPAAYKVGDTVELLVDPADQRKVVVDTPFSRFFGVWFAPAFYGFFILFMLVFSFFTRPGAARIAGLVEDPAYGPEDAPLAPDLSAAKPLGPLQGLTASADDIEQGLYPLELCEFTAYMAALAYHEPSKQAPLKLEEYLQKNFRQLRHVRCFDRDETQGFGFVLDGAVFIVMRGTTGWADWMRNLDAWYAGPKDFLPPEASWEAPGRHRGFAKGWDAVRQDIEAWIAETGVLKLDPRHPFIFAGHSLGGALSFIGAREFAERRRSVAAVITFGAARPGNTDFAERYEELGLGKRTLRLEFTEDVVPWVQQFVGYKPVGHAWIPTRLPLLSTGAALSALPLNWTVALLQSSLFGEKEEKKTSAKDKRDSEKREQEKKEELRKTESKMQRPMNLRQLVLWWAFRLVLLLAFSSVLALAAHKMQKRYALALSIMSYRRIRARHMLYDAARQPVPGSIDYDAAYDALRRHLLEVRGAAPEAPQIFTSLKGLPRKVSDVSDIRFLNAFHPSRSW